MAKSEYRLSEAVLIDVDALAASAGNRSQAVREAVCYWRELIEAAGRENAESLSPAEWELLGHTGDPTDMDTAGHVGDDGRPQVRDWCPVIALSLDQMHAGRSVLLASHKQEVRDAKKLARKIAAWGPVRGYALMAALRYFWRRPEAGIVSCSAPEIWMTPTAKEATINGQT